MAGVIEVSQLPETDKVYLKKDWFGYRVVEPIKDPISGKINWFNLICGGKKGLVFLLFLLLLIGTFYLGVNELISNYKLIADNPCNFCEDCFQQTRGVIAQMNKVPPISTVNFSNLNLQGG